MRKEWKNIKLFPHNMNRVMHKSDKDVRRQLKVISGDVKTILDIGACIGTFSLSYAYRLNDNNLRIYSFEPVPKTYDVLVNNIKLNNLNQIIKPFNFGFDSREGNVIMGVPSHRADENNDGLYAIKQGDEKLSKEISCRVVRLSDFIRDNGIEDIDIIKIDTEGKEIDILNDISGILPNVRYIHIEVNNEFDSSKKIHAFLKKNGFEYIKNTHNINEFWRNDNYRK